MLPARRLVLCFAAFAVVGCDRQNPELTGPRGPDTQSESVAPPANARGKDDQGDKLTGHAGFTDIYGIPREYSVAAITHNSGAVRGEFEYSYTSFRGSFFIRGEIFCLHVAGNTARVAGRVVESNTADAPPGSYLAWTAIDNGEGRKSAPDMTTDLFLFDQANATHHCIVGHNIGPLYPVTDGNVQVHADDEAHIGT